MNVESFPAILTAIGVFLTTLGMGGKWLIQRVEDQVKAAAAKEELARTELSTRLLREIDDLKEQIKEYKIMLREAAAEKAIYMRRVMVLELHINQHPGIGLPSMPGWPPA